MVPIPAGRLPVETEDARQLGPLPIAAVAIDAFWIDQHEVTNRQFAAFIRQTGYMTTAEQTGRARVFDPADKKWSVVQGADWRHPAGPGTSIAGREHHPVVQVSWRDAAAYARWTGRRLPSEAEWEYAARGGLYDADYPWGREKTPAGRFAANAWQGWFPDEDRAADGFAGLAPVGSFPPNRFGLYDTAGNVWEWCADAYFSRDEGDARARSPSAPPRRARRGGSWLSAENSRTGITVTSRELAPPEASSNHTGFRCASDSRPN